MKKSLLKILTVVCVLCCSFFVTACGGNSGDKSGGPSNPSNYEDTTYTYKLNPDGQSYAIINVMTSKEADDVLVVPGYHEDGKPITVIGEAYDNVVFRMVLVKTIILPDTIEVINNAAFSGNYMLQNITLGNNVQIIGNNAFESCTDLVNINIPDSVTSIGQFAFYNCRLLRNLVLGENVEYLGDRAISRCDELESITINKKLTSFYQTPSVFEGCYSLTDIFYNGTKEEWGNIEKFDLWYTNCGSFTIHCTNGDIEKEAYMQ